MATYKIVKHTKADLHIQHEGKILKYWIWGDGLIPLYSIEAKIFHADVKEFYKTEILGLRWNQKLSVYE